MKKSGLYILLLVLSFHLFAEEIPLLSDISTYNDGFSKIETVVQNNVLNGKFAIKEGALYPFCGITIPCPDDYNDFSPYSGIEIQAKGSSVITVLLITDTTQKEYNHYSYILELSPEWNSYTIPFSQLMQLWGNPSPMDLPHVISLNIQYSGKWAEKGSFSIRNISLLKKEELGPSPIEIPSFDEPQVNQLGFRPDSPKEFSIKQNEFQPGDPFHIMDTQTEKTLYTGKLGPIIDDRASSGEQVLQGDFSDFTQEGQFYITVGESRSAPFSISWPVYRDLSKAALRCYLLVRCGTAINDPETGLKHSVCHTGDTKSEAVAGIQRDFTGGWHNAGDFGKWTHITALSVNHMLLLLEWQKQGKISTVPGARGELLEEIEWGLDWLLKMQNPDGSVFHKVDTDPFFAQGLGPDKDPHERFARYGARGETTASSIDVANFTAVMFQAARVLSGSDSVQSKKYRQAAEKSLKWLDRNPPRGQNDPWYTDSNPDQELMWAYAEAYRETGKKRYLQLFKQLDSTLPLNAPGWQNTQLMGYFSLLESDLLKERDRSVLMQRMTSTSQSFLEISSESGYGPALRASDYYWGSNQAVASRGTLMIMVYLLTGDSRYLKGAQSQLDYLLGRNSLNQSFVPGFGSRPLKNPYHWGQMAYGIALPGWLTGGPNRYVSDMSRSDFHRRLLVNSGASPAKCFADKADLHGSWSSNEGALDHQASWLLLTGYLNSFTAVNP